MLILSVYAIFCKDLNSYDCLVRAASTLIPDFENISIIRPLVQSECFKPAFKLSYPPSYFIGQLIGMSNCSIVLNR